MNAPRISSVYRPPRHNIKEQQFAEFFSTLGPKFLAGGDYNSKNITWGSRITTTKGREVLKVMENNKYSFLTTATLTYWQTDQRKTPDMLDFFVARGISESYLDITACYDLSSDHSPIIATVSEIVINKQPTPMLHNRKTDWDVYKEAIQHGINLHTSLKSPQEIEHTTTQFITILQETAKLATPPIAEARQPLHIPVEIKHLIAAKRKARARWHKTHSPVDKNKFNRISNRLKAKLNEARDSSIQGYINRLSRHDNSLWKPIKSAKKPKLAIPPIEDKTLLTRAGRKAIRRRPTSLANT